MSHLSSEPPVAQRAFLEPTVAQRAFLELRDGMFIHFGPNTLDGSDWGDGKFRPERLIFPELDVSQWAEVAVAAGMKYAVLTTKHHDGFCLWPSQFTGYCVKNAPGSPDIVGMYAEAFRAAGLKVGLYYSLWDLNCPFYEDDLRYAEYMRNQIGELLTQYGDILELWFDGAWDKDFPTRKWPWNPAWENDPGCGVTHGERWQWAELYDLIHEKQPDCLVVNNSSSDRGGQVRYQPIDVRTCEHMNFVWNGKLWPTKFSEVHDGKYLPLEYCTTITPGWFCHSTVPYPHVSAAEIREWRRVARSHHANLLLNVGPDERGLIPDYHRKFLIEANAE